jgi:predicted transcriptional regulator
LLSLKPRFIAEILSRTKRVELRRRLPRVLAGDQVLMYAKLPIGKLVGSFTVASVSRLPLRALWSEVRGFAGISKAEFSQYFSGARTGVAIHVDAPRGFDLQVSLTELRRIWPGFHPPQGFRYLGDGDLTALAGIVSRADTFSGRRAA